jgi:hypothetical protein
LKLGRAERAELLPALKGGVSFGRFIGLWFIAFIFTAINLSIIPVLKNEAFRLLTVLEH